MNENRAIHPSASLQHPARTRVVRRHAVAGAVMLALTGAVALPLQALETPNNIVTPAVSGQIAGLPSFAEVAARVTPAVVNVTVASESTRTMGFRAHPGLPDDLPVPEFFRRFFDEPGRMAPHRTMGQGSGFLVDAEGHIVTNNHVIDGASEVKVVLNDGSSHPARIVGRDDKIDLALLKIDAERPLAYVEFGDSTKARVGDWVLAVGNPFGLGGSVNAGIISARGRDIRSGPYDDYLQIDAAINRGNSGGPLFDTHGRVIGVNTAIFSPTGGNIGIGFAIPAETVGEVVAELREKGRVERGWLGVRIQRVTPELAAGLGLAQEGGVLVADVLAGGPASKSELQAGDVILSADAQPLENGRELPRLVAATEPGTRMRLEVWRDGKRRQLSVTLGRMPEADRVAVAPSEDMEETNQPRLGLYLAPLTPELRAQKGLDADRTGVYVARVEPGSPASRAGIASGSLISMVGANPVDSPAQLLAAVRAAAEEARTSVILRVERDGQALFVAVPFAA